MKGPAWSDIELEQCTRAQSFWAVETRCPITKYVGYNDMSHSTDVNTCWKEEQGWFSSFLATTPLVSIFVLGRKGNWFLIQGEERQESLCKAAKPEENAGRKHGCHVNCSCKRPKKI